MSTVNSVPANPEIGEVELVLEGAPYVLRPSYECRVAIERELTRLNVRDGIERRVSVPEWTAEFLRAGGRVPSLEEATIFVYNGMLYAAQHRGDKFMQQVDRERIGKLLYKDLMRNAFPLIQFIKNLTPLIEDEDSEKKKDDAADPETTI